jgi:hypothetical protein
LVLLHEATVMQSARAAMVVLKMVFMAILFFVGLFELVILDEATVLFVLSDAKMQVSPSPYEPNLADGRND